MQIYSKVPWVSILGGRALPSSHYSVYSFVICGHYTFNWGLPSKASYKNVVWLGFIFYLNAFTKIFSTTRSINLNAKHLDTHPSTFRKIMICLLSVSFSPLKISWKFNNHRWYNKELVGFKQKKTCCLTVLESRSPKDRCWQGCA